MAAVVTPVAQGVSAGPDPARAARLRGLHRPGDPLVLPNVWDAASARTVRAAGFPAVATSSAAVAESLGYADGEATPVEEMLDAVARIAAAVDVPVTADLERGYGMAPAELAQRLAATGAVGCNLEDTDPRTGTMVGVEEQVAFLAAVRAAGPDLVVNARIDCFAHGAGTADEQLGGALVRAHAYLAAGADCVYPIMAADPAVITALVDRAGGPVNILARDGAPPVAELARLRVARVSFGPGIFRAVQAHLAGLLAVR